MDEVIPVLINLLVKEKEEKHKLIVDLQEIRKEIKVWKENGQRHGIGFTALFHKSKQHTSVQARTVLPFTHVLNSYGGGFNATDGIFYCPKKGIYMISASLVTNANMWFDIKKNAKNIGGVYKGHTGWDSGSGTVIVRLRRGDNVWLSSRGSATVDRESQFTIVRISD